MPQCFIFYYLHDVADEVRQLLVELNLLLVLLDLILERLQLQVRPLQLVLRAVGKGETETPIRPKPQTITNQRRTKRGAPNPARPLLALSWRRAPRVIWVSEGAACLEDADLVVQEAGGPDDVIRRHGGQLVVLRVVHGHRRRRCRCRGRR